MMPVGVGFQFWVNQWVVCCWYISCLQTCKLFTNMQICSPANSGAIFAKTTCQDIRCSELKISTFLPIRVLPLGRGRLWAVKCAFACQVLKAAITKARPLLSPPDLLNLNTLKYLLGEVFLRTTSLKFWQLVLRVPMYQSMALIGCTSLHNPLLLS